MYFEGRVLLTVQFIDAVADFLTRKKSTLMSYLSYYYKLSFWATKDLQRPQRARRLAGLRLIT
jgi:hypothetical protein